MRGVGVSEEGRTLAGRAALVTGGGSGIGLVLCRQIAEAHGGSLNLENRPEGRGCRALLRLPL